jgi:histidyl-tRNA synthetase
MRDLLPQQMLRREHVIRTIAGIYQSYGFEPVETPACERLEVLLGKYGEEGDQLIFRIMQRGEKLERALAAGGVSEFELADMALRYDLTVPLARVVAEYQHELPRYFKRYQIQPVWRADRPGRGRFREFYQCDVDVVGSTSPIVEVEVASAVAEVMERLGFTDFRIRLNHRRLLSGLIDTAGVPAELEGSALVAIDKLDKIGVDGVRAELEQRGVLAEAIDRLLPMLDVGRGEQALTRLDELLAAGSAGAQAVAALHELLSLAAGSPAGRYFEVDPFLARGLSYYTGPIFEVAVADLAGSLGGGGRYDQLIGMFLGRPVPACGFSLGLERILVVMQERGMFAEQTSVARVLVCLWDAALAGASLSLAGSLRAAGIAVDVFPDFDKVGKQFKYASSRGYAFACVLGPDEVASGNVAIKDLASGEQTVMEVQSASEWLRGKLRGRGGFTVVSADAT